jgi:UDP-2-acetamido-3-amino-2,3-dideoxy-glucuronate N-acetyltransferase
MTQDKFFKHETALVESENVGSGTRIWAYTHVMSGAVVGENCNICDHCFIESGAVIGNNVTIKNGVSVWDKVTIEEGAFVGPNATLTNDLWPRSRNPKWQVKETLIGRGATIGANATILCGIRIGAFTMIGAGSVVTRDLPDYALCYGNPARVQGWVCACTSKLNFAGTGATCGECGAQYLKSNQKVAPVEPYGKASQ